MEFKNFVFQALKFIELIIGDGKSWKIITLAVHTLGTRLTFSLVRTP